MLMYALYIGRLMESGLPAPNLRPGMFISVGPPAFAVIALTSLGQAAILHDDFFPASNVSVAAVLDVECKFAAIFLWGLSLWFFLLSLWATLAGARSMSFLVVVSVPQCRLRCCDHHHWRDAALVVTAMGWYRHVDLPRMRLVLCRGQ
jgi:tellurite resistance protein TehA-like permease